jgi:ATP-dependent DNA ligase
VVGGFRFHKDGLGVGSLLLGLYDDDGVLHHVGVASSFSAAARTELLADLAPYRLDRGGDGALDDHPWRAWAEAEADAEAAGQRRPGAQSRWNAGKDLSWEPLRTGPEAGLIAEVAYEHMQGDRFRHTARFQRWRPDREPSSCTYEQLEVPVPMELHAIFNI